MRNAKAIYVGVENVIREKEMAFDAQLAATEIVRRCERRVGELVKQGQDEGTILRQGQKFTDLVVTRGEGLERLHVAMGVTENDGRGKTDIHTLGGANPETFDQAIEEAKAEGNRGPVLT